MIGRWMVSTVKRWLLLDETARAPFTGSYCAITAQEPTREMVPRNH